MPSKSHLNKAASTLLVAPHEIEEWQTSETSHKSVRRLSLTKGEDPCEWHADRVIAITKHLSADRGGMLESLKIDQFIPDADSMGGDPPLIEEVLRPIAHSLTSISLDLPAEVESGTLLGILCSLPRLQEFTIYAPIIRNSLYEGEINRGSPSMTGKLGLFRLDVGGDGFINQLLQNDPIEYHTIGLSHNKLIDSYNLLINASRNTLRCLAIHHIGKRARIPVNDTQLRTVLRGVSLQTSPRPHIRRQLFRTLRTSFRCERNLRSQNHSYDLRCAIHGLLRTLREAQDLVPARSRL